MAELSDRSMILREATSQLHLQHQELTHHQDLVQVKQII
jgi:hypothetical protein